MGGEAKTQRLDFYRIEVTRRLTKVPVATPSISPAL